MPASGSTAGQEVRSQLAAREEGGGRGRRPEAEATPPESPGHPRSHGGGPAAGSGLKDCSEKLVAAWRARAIKVYPSEFRDTSEDLRSTLLAALCSFRESGITDALVDLLDALVHKVNARRSGGWRSGSPPG